MKPNMPPQRELKLFFKKNTTTYHINHFIYYSPKVLNSLNVAVCHG